MKAAPTEPAADPDNAVSIDIGGTSADTGVIHDGAPGLTDKSISAIGRSPRR
jgi:N-methylhydantoinase A/oxoprolinase/acetone carboxylase beta subunit